MSNKMKFISWSNSLKLFSVNHEILQRLDIVLNQYFNEEFSAQPKTVKVRYISGYHFFRVFQINFMIEGFHKNVYVKMGREVSENIQEIIYQEYSSTLKVFNLFSSSTQFRIPMPIKFYKDKAALILAQLDGIRLDKLIIRSLKFPVNKRDAAIAREGCKLCAKWLLKLQGEFNDSTNGYLDTVELEERVSHELKRIMDLTYPISKQLLARIEDYERETIGTFEASDLKTTAKHNDFAPWNVIIGDNSIGVLDFTDFKYDSKYYDIFYFYEALASFRDKFMIKGELIKTLQDSIIYEFSPKLSIQHNYYRYFRVLYMLQEMQSDIVRCNNRKIYALIYKRALKIKFKRLESVVVKSEFK